MAYLDNNIYDNGLNEVGGANRVLHISSAEPSTFAGVASVSLGTKTSPVIGDPAARSGGGREVIFAEILDGVVTATGTATHWALVDTGNNRLIAAQTLSASQVVTDGNNFTLSSVRIGIPGVA